MTSKVVVHSNKPQPHASRTPKARYCPCTMARGVFPQTCPKIGFLQLWWGLSNVYVNVMLFVKCTSAKALPKSPFFCRRRIALMGLLTHAHFSLSHDTHRAGTS